MLEAGHQANVHLLDETLFINSFDVDNVGEYRCVVTNQAGTSTSNSLALSIAGTKSYLVESCPGFSVLLLQIVVLVEIQIQLVFHINVLSQSPTN